MRTSLYSTNRGGAPQAGSIILAFFGIVIMTFGLISQLNYNRKKETYLPIFSSIVRYDTQTNIVEDENGDTHEEYAYCPVYEYIIGDDTYTMESDELLSTIPTLGKQKKMWINPKKQNDVVLETNRYIVIIIFGFVITILGIIGNIISLKKTNETL